MEKLESECVKLSRTQALAEVIHCVPNEKYQHVMMTGKISTTNIASSFVLQTKLAVLEQRLLKEEHERQLVQKKADKVSLHIHKYIYNFSSCKFHFTNVFFVMTLQKKKFEWALHEFVDDVNMSSAPRGDGGEFSSTCTSSYWGNKEENKKDPKGSLFLYITTCCQRPAC